MRYLIVYGTAVNEIRVGEGSTESVAARDAFSTYDAKRMTFKPATRRELQVNARRTKLCYELLLTHAERMSVADVDDALQAEESALRSAEELKRVWTRQWARLKDRKDVVTPTQSKE
jgi:hypothetical protein